MEAPLYPSLCSVVDFDINYYDKHLKYAVYYHIHYACINSLTLRPSNI